MMSLDILCEFKKQLVSFFDELIVQFPSESDLILVRIFLNDKIPMQDVIKYFMREILPLKPMIVNRDEKFFINNNILFKALDKNKVNHFKRIWQSELIDDDDKDIIWSWFDIFVSLCEKYQEKIKEE